MKSEATIVIIDDEIKGNEELLIELREKFHEVITYESSNAALAELKEYYSKKTIILLDLSFAPKEKNGHDVLQKIRDENQLIPVIIWSAANENEEPFFDLINNSAFGFLKRDASSEEILEMLNEADAHLDMSISGALEDWINAHPDEDKDKPYIITINGKKLMLNDLLKEVRMQSPLGKHFSAMLTKLTIDLLIRNKETLND